MKNITGNLKRDRETLKKLLPSEDILSFDFISAGGISFTVLYADPSPTRNSSANSSSVPFCTTRAKRRRL